MISFDLTGIISIILLVISVMTEATSNSDWVHNCNICTCHWISGKKTADCKDKNFTFIPTNLSNELQVVDLSTNSIPHLHKEEFENANLHNMHKIFMRNCAIHTIHQSSFKNLTILIELDMSHNFINVLQSGTFDFLEKLRVLAMNYNDLEILKNGLFTKLQFLSRVEFKHNRLKVIEVDAFGQLPLLSTVNLEHNLLTMLYKDTFSRMTRLKELSLAQNLWNCTCDLQEFRNFVISKRLYTPPTDCTEPPQLKGILWNNHENFACQPRILYQSNLKTSQLSENVSFSCQFDGFPRPNVTWAYNKRFINKNDYRFRIRDSIEANPTNHSNIFLSELWIYGIRSTDKGVYTCIIENLGGRAEAEFQLIVKGDYFNPSDNISGDIIGLSTSSDSDTNILKITCLIAISLLLLLIIVVLLICWYCKRVKTFQKDTTITSDNRLIALKLDNTRNGSMLEGSVIMEMQKGLLTEINPVEKPPRRTELEDVSSGDDGNDIKSNLIDNKQFGHLFHMDDETNSITLSDITSGHRSRLAYCDDNYGASLPPDLIAFPPRVPLTSPSMQSSHSNIQDSVIYGIRSPSLASPVYAHMTSHGVYGTTIATASPNGFMTLQHPKTRNLAIIAAANNRSQQIHSPFVPAPVVYSPNTKVVLKQGYMTIPRKPRVPSWSPSSPATHSTQLSEFQSPISPISSDAGTTQTTEIFSEPVYDNLGLRTTAGGNSSLNLHKTVALSECPVKYSMRDRPLPATPSLAPMTLNTPQHIPYVTQSTSKLYEPIQELLNQHDQSLLIQQPILNETEHLYNSSKHQIDEYKMVKVPPRPPPKPKKKLSVTTSRNGIGSTSQLFDDEGEDGTEV